MIGFFHENEAYGCFSNWYPAAFDYVGHFTSSEQFMMYHKVLMFRRYDLAEQILQTSDPAKCKKIAGQKFPEFNAAIWEKTCCTIVNAESKPSLPRMKTSAGPCSAREMNCLPNAPLTTKSGASASI